jgi:integrase
MAKDALHVLRGCGLRIGELLALRADCLEQDAEGFHWLRVPAHKLDNERNIPLDPETARAVSRLQDLRNDARRTAAQRGNRPVNTDRVLLRHGYPVSENYIRTALYRAADLAGLQPPPGRPRAVVPHQLRHTYATELVNAGIDVPALMDLLGHLSPDMTMHYGRISSRTLRDRYHEAIARLPQALRDAADPGDALRHDDLLRLLRTEHQKVVRELAGGKMTGSPTEGLSGLQELLSRVLAALESRQGRGGKD